MAPLTLAGRALEVEEEEEAEKEGGGRKAEERHTENEAGAADLEP
jgi:hypothetical protein|eukprot:CAMPEP_0174307760 /NCGR_PEP_ID=MMETSP0810-20121108/1323_1 /TAXON_ID=73025 ORGANISM="Eutreptiella gymnastica-like, Strain CCMP1594" /NCGR_SAMPLE_ID=MMETSP0810 /ASSEMBLY_ACC=CAM_ASM_000659 /LENGTH=44 /DNA_ID= /DNA_START= /DNA_END= /DNA_ORIENTATION=